MWDEGERGGKTPVIEFLSAINIIRESISGESITHLPWFDPWFLYILIPTEQI